MALFRCKDTGCLQGAVCDQVAKTQACGKPSAEHSDFSFGCVGLEAYEHFRLKRRAGSIKASSCLAHCGKYGDVLIQLLKEETDPAAETQSDGADAKKRERLAALALITTTYNLDPSLAQPVQ